MPAPSLLHVCVPFKVCVCACVNVCVRAHTHAHIHTHHALIPAANRCHLNFPFSLAPSIHPPHSGVQPFGVFVCDRSYASDAADHSYPASPNHPAQQILAPASHLSADNKEVILVANQAQEHVYRPSAAGSRQNSLDRKSVV